MGKLLRIKTLKIFLIISILFPLAGCWDRLELEERATILGIGIDKISSEKMRPGDEVTHFKNKFEKDDMLKLTVQLAVPGRLPLGPGQGGGGSGADPSKSVWVLSVTGKTMDDAMSKLQQQIEFKIFLGHLRIIVISDDMARKGLWDISDYFKRNSEVRRAAWLAVSEDAPEKIIKASPELERVPALAIMGTLDDAVRLGRFPNDFLGIFWSKLSSKGQSAYLPYIDLLPKDNIEVAGMAYFHKDKMVGVTKPLEIGYYMAMMGMNPGGYKVLTKIPGTDNTIMARAVKRESKIKVRLKDGKPFVSVRVQLEMDVSEKNSTNWTLKNSRDITHLEKQIAKDTQKGYLNFIKTTQKKGSDIFGFGEYVRGKEPKYWNKNIQTAEKWLEVYKDLPVDVKVGVDIRRVGMKAN